MKKLKILIGTLVLSAGLAGCSSAYYASSGYANDDLYSLHDKTAIARKQQAKAEAEKAAAEARRAEWEARIAEAQAAAAENQYYEYSSNPYEDIVADTYESAYARRLRGFESPTYRMPSSYYNFRYGGSFTYATAYDPAFYNIIISGDQVWVEPKYITSMFGTWGGSVYVDPWYYGWTRPYWGAWGPSFSFGSWGWSFGFNGWYNPWYDPWWGPGWRPGWGPGWGPGWHGGHHWAYRPHNYRLDGGGRPRAMSRGMSLRAAVTAEPTIRATVPVRPLRAGATRAAAGRITRAADATTATVRFTTAAATAITTITPGTTTRGITTATTATRGVRPTTAGRAAAVITAAAASAGRAAVRREAVTAVAAVRAAAVHRAEAAVTAGVSQR